jgi:tetratricopeptide (TPR) repeat protein
MMASRAGLDGTAEMIDAVRLSPDLPAAHMALAGAYWEEGERWLAIVEVVDGLRAIPWHLEASLWLVSSVLVMFAAVLVVGSLVFITAVACSVFSHATHDLGDLVSGSMPSFARTALLGALLFVPLALGEGLLGLVLALFAVGFIYGGSRHRMALNLAAVLLVLGLYPVSLFAGMALGALDSDPVAAAALSVVRGIESSAELELLESKRDRDLLARRTLAVRADHRGDLETSRAEYEYLLERDPADAALLANLGSLKFRAGQTEQAIELYERAVLLIDSPTLYFNLAQAYARDFRMDAYESAMARAQSLAPDAVADLSRSGNTSFVADLPHPMAPIRNRLISKAREGGGGLNRAVVELLAPGRLGRSWQVLAAGFGIVAVVSLLLSARFDHASTCNRCGRRICGRCDGTVWSSQTCEACHRLFNKPETTDSALRMARLKTLRAREQRLDRIATAAAILLPGAAGLLARRPDLSFLGILLFVWAVVFLVWRNGIVSDPFVVGAAGPLAFSIVGLIALVAYLGVVMSGLIVRRSL